MNGIYKLIVSLAAIATLTLSGCASLPDGSKKPLLEVSSVTTAENSGVKGFDLTFKIKHNSLEALKIRKITTLIAVNGKTVAQGEEEPDDLIVPTRREISIERFIPANLTRNVSEQTLQSPLFYGSIECVVKVQFSRDEQDSFNPQTVYHGIINSALKSKVSE